MLSAGISLPDSLENLVKSETDTSLRHAMISCLQALLGGERMSTGMRRHSDIFDRFSVKLIDVSEKTGSLSSGLDRLARLEEKRIGRTQRLQTALAYPLCLFLVMLSVAAVFVFFVAPGDDGLFRLLGGELPWPSLVLIQVSRLLTSPLLIGIALTSAGAIVLAFRTMYSSSSSFRLRVDRLLLIIPVVGTLVTKFETVRFFECLSSSLKIGSPLLESLSNSIGVVQNTHFQEALLKVYGDIVQGEGVGASLCRRTPIPKLVIALIEVAEETGSLDSTLTRAAVILEEELDQSVASALLLLEPMLIAIGGLIAGFVAVATFLPIMQLVATF
jgi:type IV pilus assembly protein PilC